jgi:non-ribosomal peptide synthetase component F
MNGIVPIGWIFDGQECSVIDAERTAVPVGVPGELCLCGSQVTTGYWNEPRKTQEQFVRLPGKGSGTEPEILFNKMQMVAYTIWEEWIIKSRSEAIGSNCKK